jgi:hypothetical protein
LRSAASDALVLSGSPNAEARPSPPSAVTIAASFPTEGSAAPKMQQPNVSRMQSLALSTTSLGSSSKRSEETN